MCVLIGNSRYDLFTSVKEISFVIGYFLTAPISIMHNKLGGVFQNNSVPRAGVPFSSSPPPPPTLNSWSTPPQEAQNQNYRPKTKKIIARKPKERLLCRLSCLVIFIERNIFSDTSSGLCCLPISLSNDGPTVLLLLVRIKVRITSNKTPTTTTEIKAKNTRELNKLH
jgi:hypothetical protein